VPCVKITKGNIDPFTEPDGNAGSFYYNSKWSADVKLAATDSTPYQGGSYYLPSGSTISTYQKVVQGPYSGSATINSIGIRNSYFGSAVPYTLPLFDIKIRRLSDGRYIEQNRLRTQGDSDGNGREPGYYEIIDRGISTWFANKVDVDSNTNDLIGALGNGLFYNGFTPGSANANQIEKEVIVWRLPGDETAILDGAAKAPVPGQRAVEITATACRVAKPGYDVRAATPTQLAFDSSARPLGVVGAADIALPAGVTQYDLGFPVTANMLADLFLYVDDVITFPMSRYGRSLVAEYWFSGTSIFIDNKQAACRCRFLVFANDRAALTSGTNDVFKTRADGTIQFLRPGAGNPPAFRDIVLDSRWPSVQILAQGYQAIAAQPNRVPPGSVNAGQSFTVPFNSAGLFPIVKYMTVHQHAQHGKCVKFPQTLITENYNNSTQYHQGNSTYCQLSGSQATFWTFNGNPKTEEWNSSEGWHMAYPPDPIIGIRYFILGIPQP
jgi:hypothetical protein